MISDAGDGVIREHRTRGRGQVRETGIGRRAKRVKSLWTGFAPAKAVEPTRRIWRRPVGYYDRGWQPRVVAVFQASQNGGGQLYVDFDCGLRGGR